MGVIVHLRLVCAALVAAAFLIGCPGDPGACDCFICESAVTLAIVDSSSGFSVSDFVAEYTLNGTALGEAECSGVAEAANECTFGRDPGIYNIIVRAPGYEARELTARVALEAPTSRCCSSCVRPKQILVELDPRS